MFDPYKPYRHRDGSPAPRIVKLPKRSKPGAQYAGVDDKGYLVAFRADGTSFVNTDWDLVNIPEVQEMEIVAARTLQGEYYFRFADVPFPPEAQVSKPVKVRFEFE